MQERQQTVPVDQRPKLPSHVVAPAKPKETDPKALVLKQREEDRIRAEEFRLESKRQSDEWVATLASRLEQAQTAVGTEERREIRSRHEAWIQTAQACWSKLIPADQARVKKSRLALEDFLKDRALDDIADLVNEKAA